MKKYITVKNSIIFIILLVLFNYFFMSKSNGTSADSSNSSKYKKVIRGKFESFVSCTGVISALSSVDVKARVGGNVEHLKINEGDFVKKGDLIAYLDKRNINLKVKQCEADLKSSKAMLEKAKLSYDNDKKSYNNELLKATATAELNRANLQLLKKGSRPEEISQGQAQVDMANANYDNARKSYERQKELFQKNLISQSALEAAKAALDVNEAQVRTAREKLALLKNGYQSEDIQKAYSQYEVSILALEDSKIKIESLKIREQEIKDFEASVQKSELMYEDALEQLKDTTVLAPITGIVSQKYVDEGGFITSGMSSVNSGTTILTLSDLSQVRITANVDESDIHKLRENLPCHVKLDAFAKKTFAAKLYSIGPRVYLKDNVPVIDVTLELLSGTDEVKVGMSADADIIISEKEDAVMVPTESIIERGGKHYVKLSSSAVAGTGKEALHEITIGDNNGEYTVILAGLEENDRVWSLEALKEEKSELQGKKGSGLPFGPPRQSTRKSSTK
ncbi:MAG: HlyD family efflux transporter periplasmic adaptor subunit [Candidatus Wallbacteria bacterium]